MSNNNIDNVDWRRQLMFWIGNAGQVMVPRNVDRTYVFIQTDDRLATYKCELIVTLSTHEEMQAEKAKANDEDIREWERPASEETKS